MGQPKGVHGPAIPERTCARTSSTPSPAKERKRRSLPATPQQHESRRRTSNRVALKPASPEVISSLIDTLSAISSPPEGHSDNLPNITESQSTPASPSAWKSTFSPSGSSNRAPPLPTTNGLGADRKGSIAGSSTTSHRCRLHPPEPGTRRSSRRISSEASSKSKTREAAYEDLLDDAYSIGTPSIEPGLAPEPSPRRSSRKKSLRSLASARSLRSLRLRPSVDSLPNSDLAVYPKKEPNLPKRERIFIGESRSPSSSPKDLSLKKRDDIPDAFDLLHSPDDILPLEHSPTTAKRLWLESEKGPSSTGPNESRRSSYQIPSYDYIPRRDSSQRHSPSLTSEKRRSRVARSERSSVKQESEANAGEDQFHTPPQTPPGGTIAKFDEASVNRRIEELKEQKAKRELERAELSVKPLDLPVRKGSRSPSPSPLKHEHSMNEVSPTAPRPTDTIRLVEEPAVQQETDDFAPSPAIRSVPLRTDRNTETRISSLSGSPITMKQSPAHSRDETKSANLHQRSNSKMLRRLSQHAGSPTSEKHRRRFSNPLGYAPPVRQTSHLTDGGDSIDDAVSDYLHNPRLSQKIVHPQTGRVISFSQVGDPHGSVVFCCVGMGLTRYITAFYDELATTLKLRLITPDRPGVGGSEPHADGKDTPLGWPDDVRTICEQRGITKFSILAHSAGAIYALATALRMPQHIRCRVHLLAPWIPPSQMSAIGTHQEPLPATAMPYSQRFLRSLPTTFLRAANSSFLNFTSNSITTSLPRSPKRTKKGTSRSVTPTPADILNNTDSDSASTRPFSTRNRSETPKLSSDKENRPPFQAQSSSTFINISNNSHPSTESISQLSPLPPSSEKSRQPFPRSQTAPPASLNPTSTTTTTLTTPKPTPSVAAAGPYESRLASRIWDLATTNANPSVDLLVCLERRQPIGFRYVDITRSVVIHHGSKDSRVPLDNVKWLAKMMRRCEVRVLEGEGHGLMASAGVMGGVLMEMAGEWEDWLRVVGATRKG